MVRTERNLMKELISIYNERITAALLSIESVENTIPAGPDRDVILEVIYDNISFYAQKVNEYNIKLRTL